MKLELHITEKDVYTLTDLGFINNSLGVEEEIEVDEEKQFEAIKTYHEDRVAVAIEYVDKKVAIKIYKYDGEKNNHHRVGIPKDIKPFLQDLIDAGLVEYEE
jgi:hypothetical protein